MAAKPLSSVWKLTKASLATWNQHAKILTLVVALVAVPTNLLQLLLSAGDTTLSAYVSLAALVMNLALIWAIIRLESGDKKVSLRQAYYEGTASLVRFLLVSFLLVAELVPLAIGLLLYNVGVAGAAPGTTGFEEIIISLLALALAVPSLFWFNRSLLALVLLPGSELRPMTAVKQSWRSVRGRSWQVLRKLLGLVLVAGLLIAVPAIILVLLYEHTTNRGFLALLQLFASLAILPLIDIYLYKLSQELA